jgi:hypothetical protein
MITPKPADLLEVLAELRRRYPAWRFGQLIANVAGWADREVWDIEDDVLLDTAQSHLEAVAKREQKVTV